MKKNKIHILYIVPVFPVLSETFIIREINALIEKGVHIDVYALRKQSSGHKLSNKINIYYTDYSNLINKIIKVLFFIIKQPITYSQILISCIAALLGNDFLGFGPTPGKSGNFLNASIRTTIKNIRDFHIGIFISSIIKKDKYKSMYAHWSTGHTIVATIHRFTKLPYSSCIHANECYTQQSIALWIFEHCKYIVVNNKYNIHYFNLVTDYRFSDRIRLIYNCPPQIETQFQPRKSIDNKVNLLSIGRLVYFKDHPTLINACKILKDNNINFRLTIAGSGPCEVLIKKLVKQNDLNENVRIIGSYQPDEVWKLFSSHDILIHTSGIGPSGTRDGLPNVIIESMLAGVPVIASYISSIPELIVDGETGCLVAEKDPQMLYENILELKNNKVLYNKLSVNGIRFSKKRFDTEITTKSLLDIF